MLIEALTGSGRMLGYDELNGRFYSWVVSRTDPTYRSDLSVAESTALDVGKALLPV